MALFINVFTFMNNLVSRIIYNMQCCYLAFQQQSLMQQYAFYSSKKIFNIPLFNQQKATAVEANIFSKYANSDF